MSAKPSHRRIAAHRRRAIALAVTTRHPARLASVDPKSLDLLALAVAR